MSEGNESVCREEQIVAVDVAGLLGMDDMVGGADEPVVVPEGMKEIQNIHVSGSSDLAALGSGVGAVILTGPGLVHAPQHILIMAGGAELINAAHVGLPTYTMPNMGIRVKEGSDIICQGIMVGEDMGTISLIIELEFSPQTHGPAIMWVGGEIQIAALGADAQLAGMGDGVAATIKALSDKIVAIQTALGGDQAALGSGCACAKLSGIGVILPQDIILGANGGELIVGAGFIAPPNKTTRDIHCRKNNEIRVDCRQVGETPGTQSVAIVLGFEMGR